MNHSNLQLIKTDKLILFNKKVNKLPEIEIKFDLYWSFTCTVKIKRFRHYQIDKTIFFKTEVDIEVSNLIFQDSYFGDKIRHVNQKVRKILERQYRGITEISNNPNTYLTQIKKIYHVQ